MLYPFMTLNDGTEIVYSSPIPCGDDIQVKVVMETPIQDGFKDATCLIPGYVWENHGYSYMEMEYLKKLVTDVAPLLIKLSKEGGIESA